MTIGFREQPLPSRREEGGDRIADTPGSYFAYLPVSCFVKSG